MAAAGMGVLAALRCFFPARRGAVFRPLVLALGLVSLMRVLTTLDLSFVRGLIVSFLICCHDEVILRGWHMPFVRFRECQPLFIGSSGVVPALLSSCLPEFQKIFAMR